MSLYNLLFNENKDTDKLLHMLNLNKEDFGRFRDIYLNGDGNKIIVYTRCGGGNREDYDWVFDDMEQHPNYIKNYDDNFDVTYCYFEFSIPDEYKEECKNMATGIEPDNVTEKFNKFAEQMQNENTEEYKKGQEVAKHISQQMENMPDGGVIEL